MGRTVKDYPYRSEKEFQRREGGKIMEYIVAATAKGRVKGYIEDGICTLLIFCGEGFGNAFKTGE